MWRAGAGRGMSSGAGLGIVGYVFTQGRGSGRVLRPGAGAGTQRSLIWRLLQGRLRGVCHGRGEGYSMLLVRQAACTRLEGRG